jgi:diacylglycerol kinase family enzyme
MVDSAMPAQARETSAKPQRVCVLLNHSAGSSDGNCEQLGITIEASFRASGIAACVESVAANELEGAATRVLEKLKDAKVDALVVGGGDGTIGTVASVLAGSGYPMGILPLGTLNHFAKDLRIPLDLDQAVATIATGHLRHVDVGDMNGRTFVNNSSIGIYPYMVLDRERRQRTGLPKWLAMIPATLRTLRNLPLRRLSIAGAGPAETFRSPCVFIGNNEYHLAGSSVGRRDRLDRGCLSVHVARSQSRLGLILLALRPLLNLLDTGKDLRSFQLPAVTIKSSKKRLLVALDGEIAMVRTPLNYAIRPGALRVFAGTAP